MGMRPSFDSSCRNEFRNIYSQHPQETSYVIDLKIVNYLDSSALGMLINFTKHNGEKSTTKLINCSKSVKQIFKTTGVVRLFEFI
jgi:HptB-dependent secretion and biofilm anti anti-sigma factor